MPQRPPDPDLERSTDRWITAGIVVTVLFVLAFPAFRFYEPSGRTEARATLTASLVDQGSQLFQATCATCHGVNGEGVDAPALNSQQFLSIAANDQIEGLVAHGIPGSEMASYAIDHGGTLTSEQIKAITIYLRSLEPDAPDRPDWRILEEPADGHDDEEPADAHDE